MGQTTPHTPALLILAVISRYEEAQQWARQKAAEAWGPELLASESFQFVETDYYETTMGSQLKKTFLVFDRPLDPAGLAAVKHLTNAWEAQYAGLARHPEPRPLNLDPGYLTAAKLVLASTKDHAHRIYLSDGIYAEVTLHYTAGRWQHRPWTFPDYRRSDYQQFFSEARQQLRRRQRGARPG